MIKDIKYTGYTTVPSDYECSDGELAMTLNLINDDGAMFPVAPPHEIKNYGDYTPAFIHKTNSGDIVILRNNRLNSISVRFAMLDKTEPSPLVEYSVDSGAAAPFLIQISSLENILLILTQSGVDHFLWDAEASNYKSLGKSVPNLELSFGLKGKVEYTEEYSTGINSVLVDDRYDEWIDETQNVITSAVLAKVNKFIADNATSKGRFIFPFFVRYALRLFDGSLINHSAPVLMHAASGETPNVLVNSLDKQQGSDNHYEKMRFRVAAVCHKIDFKVISTTELLNSIKSSWSDIVKSVDIFISAPIYTFNPNGLCRRFIEDDVDGLSCVCQTGDAGRGDADFHKKYKTFDLYRNVFYNKIHDDMKPYFNRRCELPTLSDTTPLVDKIKNTSQFYLLKSIKIEDLTQERTIIDVPDDYLSSLVARETMTDDYDSHDTIIAANAFNYNSRINLANITKRIFPGFSIKNSLCYNDETTCTHRVVYYVKENGRTIITEAPYTQFGEIGDNLYLYHPSPNAYRALIYRHSSEGSFVCECPLRTHDFLIGAFYYNDSSQIEWRLLADSEKEIAPTADDRLFYPSKIYTSEVNNPFLFPTVNIITVGSGTVLGLSSAAKALSQGQFGQYPLYAFTSEGVWALEVSSTGTYSARQPITRDVCCNPAAITQIDSAVIYPTQRGLMCISGSQSECISTTVNSEQPVNLLSLPHFGEYILYPFCETDPLVDRLMPVCPLTSFLKSAQIIYDYTHQRLYIFDPQLPYAYIYSFKSHCWGLLYSDLKSALNSYPDALAVNRRNSIVNFATSVVDTVKSMLVTRPLKLDNHNIHKTIDTIIQRGNFPAGSVQSVLYGSRDLRTWHLVWSSKDNYLRGFRGTPYKYFRIALLCNLSPGESIYGASVQFLPRLTNQPR